MLTRQQLLEIADRLLVIQRQLFEAAEGEHDAGSLHLTSRQAALLVPCASGEAFRKWARRNGVVGLRRGRDTYYDRRDIELAKTRRVVGESAGELRKVS
jgi:hypothetical protein